MESNWKTIDRLQVYDNPWIRVEHRNVITPANTPGIYGVVSFKNVAIGILPIDKHMNTYIVGQFRYVLDRYSWEIPEGGSPIGESPLDSAKRELKEETGLTARHWHKILELDISNSVTNEKSISYIASGLELGLAEPEDTEEIQVRKLPFEDVWNMAMSGKITDALSVATIFKTKILLNDGQLNFPL